MGKRNILQGDRFVPHAAPSTGAFAEISPQGSGRDAARFRRGRKPLPKTLGKSEERREKAAFGSPFLWILSFGDTKESIAVAGPRTGFKSNLAVANHC
ncbi:hypothetical protein A1353_09485 [Methylomonas methanica]|uniref:Uncharacterized protein n=1 Tax=Methylomonas methanica TaxID=421 RepID=A0A177MLD9_METMH|nr:hypothetical protein A1353_09485 [Methylomonas methanica]